MLLTSVFSAYNSHPFAAIEVGIVTPTFLGDLMTDIYKLKAH